MQIIIILREAPNSIKIPRNCCLLTCDNFVSD